MYQAKHRKNNHILESAQDAAHSAKELVAASYHLGVALVVVKRETGMPLRELLRIRKAKVEVQ